MRVSVIINSKAGSVDPDLIEAKVRNALFRCDLRFVRPANIQEMCDFLHGETANGTDYFIICGGDGTINACLQCLMVCQKDLKKFPPIAIVRSGTANDLAHEMGVSEKIDVAVRNILEGTVKNIDVIEVSSGEKKAYMITNGGLGLPALTADYANLFRQKLQKVSTCPKANVLYKIVAQQSYRAVKKIGPKIYSLMITEALRNWKQEGWALDVTFADGKTMETTAPIILINNQPSLGAGFLPAPYTSNSDGTVNLLLGDSNSSMQTLNAITQIRNGQTDQSQQFKSFELPEFRLKSKNPQRTLTFFGDGEILFKNVTEVTVRCLHRGLPIVVRQ